MKKLVSLLLVLLLACLSLPVFAEEYEDGNPPLAPELCLKGNATTGYEWLYTVDDPKVVTVTDNGYVVDEGGENMVGVGGEFLFRLDGTAPGTATVVFRYAQSWEEGSELMTISYTLYVDEELNAHIYSCDVTPC